MPCPELPGRLSMASSEDADGVAPEICVEFVHHFPGPLPTITVQLAPEGGLPGGFGEQFCNHDAAFRVAEAIPPKPFARAHRQGNHFAGVVGGFREARRRSIRVEGVVVEGFVCMKTKMFSAATL